MSTRRFVLACITSIAALGGLVLFRYFVDDDSHDDDERDERAET